MNRFAELLDRLAYEAGRNNKLRLMTDYFRTVPDPERGFALAALTGALSFQYAKPGMIRSADRSAHRRGAVRALVRLCRRSLGNGRLMWPADPAHRPNATPSLSDVVATLSTLGKAELPAQLARWLDALDETGRWALLKLVTGALRVGVSARLAKTAAAALGGKDAAGGRADLARPRAALPRPVCLARRPRRQTGKPRPGAVPPGDARACARGR